MKINFYVIIFLSFMMKLSNGQVVDPKIVEMNEVGLVDSNQALEMEKWLDNYQGRKKNLFYISELFQAEVKKKTGIRYGADMYFNFEKEELNEKYINEVKEELVNYLQKLKKIKLVNENQFKSQLNQIQKGSYVHLLQFLKDLVSQVAYDEWLNKDTVSRFILDLEKNNVITKEEKKELLDIDQIETPYQIINYCNKARFFDLSMCSENPLKYIEYIHKVTSDILPELNFSDFKFEILKDEHLSEIDYEAFKLLVSLRVNNKCYKFKSYINPNKIGQEFDFLGKLDRRYFKIFNKVLRDNQSPYRLHLIKSSFGYKEKSKKRFFGVVALKKDQVEMFRKFGALWDISYESFENELTTSKVDFIVSEYEKLGLFNNLSKEQVKESIEGINEIELLELNDVINSFPNQICSFDYELGNIENPYEEIILRCSEISHDDFTPTNIIGDFNIQNIETVLKFDFRKKYMVKFKVDNDWVDQSVVKFLKSIAVENELKGRFYQLEGDEVNLIYLTKNQYNYLRVNKLLNFSKSQ